MGCIDGRSTPAMKSSRGQARVGAWLRVPPPAFGTLATQVGDEESFESDEGTGAAFGVHRQMSGRVQDEPRVGRSAGCAGPGHGATGRAGFGCDPSRRPSMRAMRSRNSVTADSKAGVLPRSWVAVVAGEASSQVVGFPDVDPCALTFRTLGQDQPVEPGHILQWGERRLVAAIKSNGAPVEPLQADPHIDRFVDGAPVSGRVRSARRSVSQPSAVDSGSRHPARHLVRTQRRAARRHPRRHPRTATPAVTVTGAIIAAAATRIGSARVSWRRLSSEWRARPEPRRGMVLDRLVADGYGLIGGVGEYEHIWRMAYVPGRKGIIVALAERID